jgi:hypothetical protein
MPAISQLAYDDRFVRELPADPRTDLALRQVDACFSRVKPTLVSKPELLILIPEVAKLLHLEPSPELVEVLAGNRVVDGMQPYAACYGGHQFGNWAGQLGDGRAITLGEVMHAPRAREHAGSSSSRAPDPRRIRGARTGEPCCARRCARWCAARRCSTSACPPRARCRWSGRGTT